MGKGASKDYDPRAYCLPATVGKVDGVRPLDSVAVAVLVLSKVSSSVLIVDAVREAVRDSLVDR